MQEIYTLYPGLSSVPLVNDEADPMKGWWRREWWREGVEYAILVTKGVFDQMYSHAYIIDQLILLIAI